jgi:uncharacterized protein
MIRTSRWAAALLAAATIPAAAQVAHPARVVYDVYTAGVAVADLTVRTVGGQAGYRLRKRNPATGEWSPGVIALQGRVAADTAFQLPGALGGIVARLASIDAIDWRHLAAVGWPTAASIYVPAEQREARVAGRTAHATRWVLQEGARPLDLIIGDDGRLVAAVDPGGDHVLVRRGAEGFTTVAAWRDPAVSQPRYGYRDLGKIMVPMPDGVRLATRVYLPDGPDAKGPFPVVFIRTPYGIGSLISGYWHYATRGFALVFQAARGTAYWDPENRSEGSWVPMINEPADGRAALDWIVAQPWADGKICMQGGSYVGYTQWSASMAGNPALKCLVPESSMGTAFSDQPYMGGSFVEGMLYYMLYMLDLKVLPGRHWTDILHHRPLVTMDDYATGQDIPGWNTFWDHQTNDDYWARQDWYRDVGRRGFGAFMISGWFDDDFPGTESNWNLMTRTGTVPQRLLIGPWKHGYNADRALNGYRFGPEAVRDDIWLLKQRWYDHFLKGVDNGVDQPTVQYFVLGANQWRTARAWPPKEAIPETWYFHSGGNAQRLLTAGSLTREAPTADEPPDTWRYDPKAPPANWMTFEQMQRWEDQQTWPYDFKDVETRPDVVVYTSPPLEEDLTVAGDLTAVLYASTDVKDTDWWVHVADVDTSGHSNRITMGMLRARFRNLEDPQHHVIGSNFGREDLLSGNPADVVQYRIWIRSIANTFKKGHRIRIAVMNAVDNYSFPNSNTGGDEGTVTETVVGTMSLHHGPGAPSHVVLPVISRGTQP